MPDDAFDAAHAEGRHWQIDDALRHALAAQAELVAA